MTNMPRSVTLYTGRSQLRVDVHFGWVVTRSDFSLPRLHTKFGEHNFTYAGPSEWNSLPKDLRAVTDPGLFRKLLKIHFLVWLSVFANDTDDSVMHL